MYVTARASKILSKDSTQIFGNHILSTDEYFVRLKASAKKIRHDIAISTPSKPYSNWFSKESKRFYG